jgi:hypothetical protein
LAACFTLGFFALALHLPAELEAAFSARVAHRAYFPSCAGRLRPALCFLPLGMV